MAIRDKSQGHAFIYTNVPAILHNLKKQSEAKSAEQTTEVKVQEPGLKLVDPTAHDEMEITSPLHHLKENLEKLNNLHTKLKLMLEDLDKLVKK